jgi:esterase
LGYEASIADLVATLDTLDAPVLLVGHSTGHKWPSWPPRPARTRSPVWFCFPPVPLGGAGLSAEQLAPFIELGCQPQRQRALREQLSVVLTPERLDRLVREGAQFTPATAEASARSWNAGDPAGDEPTTFGGPIMIVWGANDPFVTQDLLETGVLSRLPEARLLPVPRAGHWPHIEQPATLFTLLRRFRAAIPVPEPEPASSEG